jgi:hypothetical protein
VLASHPYDAADYIRDYEAFRALKAEEPPTGSSGPSTTRARP